jgi:DNA-directed RNA polymerase I, II, and III subunit RPABC2
MSDIDDNYSISSNSSDSSESSNSESNLRINVPDSIKHSSVIYDDDDIELNVSDDEIIQDDDDNIAHDKNINKNVGVDAIDVDVDDGDDFDDAEDNYNDDDSINEDIEDSEDDDEEINETNKQTGGKPTKNNKNVTLGELNTTININSQNSDSDNDSDYEDEKYLQKFNNEVNKNYVTEFHPECFNHNYDEITALSKVTRDEFNIIVDPLHKTIPYLTKYEKTRILGQRAKQIECGAKPLVKVPENIIDSYIIAELELQQKRIPFIIRRPLPNGSSEYWNLKDLEIITF